MQDITAVILTKDEEIHIARCIASVQHVCREVLVVDSYSTDKTCDIARTMGARVVQHPFSCQAEQFNWAIDNVPIDTEWIWRVDADEIIEAPLVRLAEEQLPKWTARQSSSSNAQQINGVYVNKKIVFMGRPLMHGGWYPAPQIKVIRRGFGRSEDKLMDEHLIITSGQTAQWNADQTDWNLKPLDWWWDKHRGYAHREALMQARVERGAVSVHPESDGSHAASAEVNGRLTGTDVERKRWMKNLYGHCPRYLRAVVYFIARYILLGGFLDGYAGWYWHTRQGLFYRLMVDREIGRLRKESTQLSKN
jgi:glycosyltransferase involved in cell wall biosynthesis